MVYDPSSIVRHYLRTWFLLDLLAQMPVDTILRVADGTFHCSLKPKGCPQPAQSQPSLFRLFKLLRLARLVKLLRLIRITRLFDRYQDDFFEYLPLLSIVKLFVGLIFIGHVIGSFFYFFSQPEWMSDTERRMYRIGSDVPASVAVPAPTAALADGVVIAPPPAQDEKEGPAYRENWIRVQRLDTPGALPQRCPSRAPGAFALRQRVLDHFTWGQCARQTEGGALRSGRRAALDHLIDSDPCVPLCRGDHC